MQQNKVLDLTLAEVRELIKDPKYLWRDRASCLGLETSRFISENNMQGKGHLLSIKNQLRSANYVMSDLNVLLIA